MNKKISMGLTITLVAIGCTITFLLTTAFSLGIFNNSVRDVKKRAEIYDKIDDIDSMVRNNYIKDVDQQKLLDAIAEGYISVLDDKYARYLSADDYKNEKKQDDGYLVGIGITVKKDESGYMIIDSVMDNSPASEMLLKEGELIIAVNGKDILSMQYSEAVSMITGDAGTVVKLSLRKDGVDRDVSLTRREMEISSVNSKMIGNVGYIKITQFNTKTAQQFNDSVKALTSAGAKGLIFDVRNNGGGLLNPTLNMLDTLLPEGTIATATYKNGKTEVLGTSKAGEVNLPMVVLVNSKTASAAELFSSALRDFDKATLVGTNTFGKGVMQDSYELSDGSCIVFTVAKYQTSKTPNFDGVGLKPNYEIVLEKDSDSDLKKLNEKTDPQLKKALEIVTSQK